MKNVVPFKKLSIKQGLKSNILSFCRVDMTATYTSTSCNSENIVTS